MGRRLIGERWYMVLPVSCIWQSIGSESLRLILYVHVAVQCLNVESRRPEIELMTIVGGQVRTCVLRPLTDRPGNQPRLWSKYRETATNELFRKFYEWFANRSIQLFTSPLSNPFKRLFSQEKIPYNIITKKVFVCNGVWLVQLFFQLFSTLW